MNQGKLLPAMLLACVAGTVWGQDSGDTTTLAPAASDTVASYESEIRSAVDGYIDAINRGDAAAAAEYWSETGQIVSADGNRLLGKAAISENLKMSLGENSQRMVSVSDVTIRLLAPTVAIEEGLALETDAEGTSLLSDYQAIHVKQDGKWKLESLKESAIKESASSHDHLKELEWMIGDWIDQEGETTIQTHVRWTSNGSFMTRSFSVETAGVRELEGTQVIGWDPNRQQIRSWVFDSDGGFGSGAWTRSGDQWIVNGKFTVADGQQGSSTNTFTYVDANTFKWKSTDRKLGDEPLIDVAEVAVSRVVQ